MFGDVPGPEALGGAKRRRPADHPDVIGALDHARIAQGPRRPGRDGSPGQHHVRMNMYIARSEGGTFKVVKNLGHIDPKEGEVGL